MAEDGAGREGGSAPPSPPVPSTSAAFDAAPSVNRPGRAKSYHRVSTTCGMGQYCMWRGSWISVCYLHL